ncbi:MAG: (d)CMP kinase [Actinomycetota bacterium]
MSDLARRVVAIDGPSGSGKSTVARGVAAALGLAVLDTGAMYRAVTLAVLEAGADPADEVAGAAIAAASRIAVDSGVTTMNGRDVSAEIRTPAITVAVSAVAAQPQVRRVLVECQRAWIAAHDGGVVEGRDIGTAVVPDAAVKVYLVASDDERARRRHQEEHAAARDIAVSEVAADITRRDRLDSGRVASPLRPAEDAVVLDTTARTVDEVVAAIVARFRETEG